LNTTLTIGYLICPVFIQEKELFIF